MSAILDALDRNSPSKGSKPSFSGPAPGEPEPDERRPRRGRGRRRFVLAAVCILAVCGVISVGISRVLVPGHDTVPSSVATPEPESVEVSLSPTETDQSKERINQLETELAFMKQSLDRLAENRNRPAAYAPPLAEAPSSPASSNPGAVPASPSATLSAASAVSDPGPDAGTDEVAEAVQPVPTGVKPVAAVPAAQRPQVARPAPAGEPDMTVQGTMVTPKGPAAMVDGQMVCVGDMVEGWKVSEVGDGYIRLEGWPKRIYIK